MAVINVESVPLKDIVIGLENDGFVLDVEKIFVLLVSQKNKALVVI